MLPDSIDALVTQVVTAENPSRKEEVRQQLILAIQYLIENDFDKLVQILYRVDVDEENLKRMLREDTTDAPMLIADLIIHRQLEKLHTKRSFPPPTDIPENEKW